MIQPAGYGFAKRGTFVPCFFNGTLYIDRHRKRIGTFLSIYERGDGILLDIPDPGTLLFHGLYSLRLHTGGIPCPFLFQQAAFTIGKRRPAVAFHAAISAAYRRVTAEVPGQDPLADNNLIRNKDHGSTG